VRNTRLLVYRGRQPEVVAASEPLEEAPNDVVLFFAGSSVKQVQDSGKHSSLPESAIQRSYLLQKMIDEKSSGPVTLSLSEEMFRAWLSFLTGPDSETRHHATREKLIQVLQVCFTPFFAQSAPVLQCVSPACMFMYHCRVAACY
jgi:hypothetical protein